LISEGPYRIDYGRAARIAFVAESELLSSLELRQWFHEILMARPANLSDGRYFRMGSTAKSIKGGSALKGLVGFRARERRLVKAKRHYDPDNVFLSAIPADDAGHQQKCCLNANQELFDHVSRQPQYDLENR
jgi:hypothetical protein